VVSTSEATWNVTACGFSTTIGVTLVVHVKEIRTLRRR